MPATGPTTEAGKAASSRNAVRHGLLSEAPVVTCIESPEEWESHRAGVLADLGPRGQMETCLAERAALLIWRLRRTAQAEIHWLDDRHHKDAHEKKRNRSYMPGFDAITCVTRYEAHLGRELARTMKALNDLQSRPAANADQSKTSTLQSPIYNSASPAEERTLNGSARFQPAPASPETQNCETNGSGDDCETAVLHHSTSPADSRSDMFTEPAAASDSENCETNSHPVVDRSETSFLPHSTIPAERDAFPLPGPITARDVRELTAMAMAPIDAILANQRRQADSLERRLGITVPERKN